ncbi:YjbH domain-containing protein [Halopseudomonas nanhaiensis]|uniref:YjbH domain-containing protein n=1 Tax=Halopseudomonas nanhaiensis TaxID=2830842 RepID=UPI001CC04BC9|nr:YjbH domain-containing protein [Halopseudomonas nanhaiensis]
MGPALLAALGYSPASIADRYRTTQHDFGGVGLLQTPTARMAPEGEFSFNANRTSPYSRYSVSVQPLPWLEGTIRYMAITNRLYGPNIAGDQSYKDKAVDVKARVWEESYWLPDVAIGMRDIGGTGLFSSEYVVANKRFLDFDVSLGLAWGYIGNRGDFRNPFSVLGSNFNERPGRTAEQVGDFNQDNYYRGRPGVFGGVEYQTPWDRLRLKLELDGNDYRNEPQNNDQQQDSPFNLGAVFSVTRGMDVHAAWERGNTAMLGVTFHTNLKTGASTPKVLDPAPEAREPPTGVTGQAVDWEAVSQRLQRNAGLDVQEIAERDGELIITAEQTTYRSTAKGLGRASRVLDNATSAGTYDWYTLRHTARGVTISETSLRAERLRDLDANRIEPDVMRRAVVSAQPSVVDTDVLYAQPLDRFDVGLSLGYNQNVGGPDGFILYQFLARADAEYRFARNSWVHGSVAANLINNFDKFRYDAPSRLPRVRTNLRQFLTTSDVVIENLQFTQVEELTRDWYGMVYGGLLEGMFGGVGGEVLLRQHGETWAVGADLNWVRQRGFAQDFSFRDYSVVTGHVTGYLQTGYHNVLAKGSVGRYLAGDLGATLDLSRRFDNGVTVGAWVTRTDVPAEQFGEGSFDKGVYFTLPFDAFFARSTRSRGTIVWNPLTRDGGARLARYYGLYELTSDRDREVFESGFDQLVK